MRRAPAAVVQSVQLAEHTNDWQSVIVQVCLQTGCDFAALGGNLGGISSGLLGLDGGQFAAQLHLDVLVPVRGFKRCVDAGNGFEFQYPAEWLADQTLYRRAVQRAEAARSLDPQPIRRRQREVAEPSAAFGPAGSTWVWACAMLCHGFILLVSILLSTVDSIGKWHGGITCATE
eukprot:GHUV01022696.1.p2 GENE.GHUV01022696.1~~GHUV01022696.1.p2  ORF type:complete len:175 (+),score=40.34 GHUV01022696.1:1250-1774(+)